MSIAEMIMQGGKQQSQSWSVLSENLGRLGQQVGNQLAMREYQKQAAEALPAMQAAYRSAMDDVAKGQTAAGYRKFMDAQFQFGTSQNPFIAQANTQAGSIFENAITVREKQLQRQAQYGGGGPMYEVPSMEELRSGQEITTKAVLPVFEVGTEDLLTEGGQPAGQPEAELLPEKQPYQGTPAQRTMQAEADKLDRENAESLPRKEPSEGENPFETGFATGSVSRYVASEKYRKVAAEAFMDAVKATPEQRKATIKSITEETEVIPENAFRVNMPVFGDGYIVGPSMEARQEVKEKQLKEKFTAEGREAERTEKMGPAELTEAQQTFKKAMQTFGASTSMFRYNPQLAKIMEAAGGDPTKIQVDQEDIEAADGKVRTVYKAFVNGVDLGELSTQTPLDPEGKPDPTALSELAAVNTMIGAPDMVARFGGKFIPIKKPAAAQPAAGGLPAVQAQAPAPAAPEIPKEAAALQQIIKQGQAAKTGEQAKATEKRIKDIDAEIKRLSSPTTVGTRIGGGMLPAGYTALTITGERTKTPEEAQADIQKITKLKAEKDAILGKTQTPKSKFNSQEDVIKAIKSGQLTREQGKTILQNQFGLQ